MKRFLYMGLISCNTEFSLQNGWATPSSKQTAGLVDRPVPMNIWQQLWSYLHFVIIKKYLCRA